MKTQLILKTAVVAMAAFGAYAFGGNSNSEQGFYIHDGDDCVPIMTSECSLTGSIPCEITIDSKEVDVWSDTICSKRAFFL